MYLKLRLASTTDIEAELARVRAFYGQNPSQYVRERDPDILRTAIGRSSAVLIEDENRTIFGSCVQISHGDGLYSETGGVRVLINGFGLQAIMMSICAINEYIFSPPTVSIFAITAVDNEASIKNIQRAGFVLDSPDTQLLSTIGYDHQFPETKRFFCFHRDEAAKARDMLLLLKATREIQKATREIQRGPSAVSIELEHPLFRPANVRLLEQI